MALLYYDELFLEHETGSHPEQPERLRRVSRHLTATGLDQQCLRPAWQSVSAERLARIHQLPYVEQVKRFAAQGGGRIEADTVVSSRSYDVALHAAGATCDAVARVLRGEDTRAFCLVRPPGHHAVAAKAMGFCLFNNVAIAARLATAEFDLDRVLIIDWDVHHGNGTQGAFWRDERVGFVSIHRWPFYPGTGAADETGTGRGLGYTLNLPVTFGTPRKEYLKRLETSLTDFVKKLSPQLVLVSAGFDSHRADPIGSLGLEVDDFSRLTRLVVECATSCAGGRLVSVLEGGYNVEILPDCVEVHLRALLEKP